MERGRCIVRDIVAQKSELRDRMKAIRSRVSAASRKEQSLAASRLAENEVLSPLRLSRGGRLNVFCYMSFRDEPETLPLIHTCLKHGDRVLVPKVNEGRKLTLHEMKAIDELTPGVWGILEPGDDMPQWPAARYKEIDIIIVPGLAYDRYGGRIGYGGGYYDRFIEQVSVAGKNGAVFPIKASLALMEQIVPERVPMEEHDFRLDMLFAASGMIYI